MSIPICELSPFDSSSCSGDEKGPHRIDTHWMSQLSLFAFPIFRGAIFIGFFREPFFDGQNICQYDVSRALGYIPFSSRIAFLIYTFLSPFSQTLCCWQFHCPLAPKNKHVLFGTKMIALLLGSMVFCIENAKQVELLRQYGYDLRVEKSWPVSLAGLLLCCMCNLSCEFLTQKLCLRHLNLVVEMLVITTLFGVMPLSCLVFWQKQQTVTFLTCLFLSLSNTRQTSQTNMICFLGSLRLILYLAFRSSGPKYPLKSTGNPFQFCLPTQNLGNPRFRFPPARGV